MIVLRDYLKENFSKGIKSDVILAKSIVEGALVPYYFPIKKEYDDAISRAIRLIIFWYNKVLDDKVKKEGAKKTYTISTEEQNTISTNANMKKLLEDYPEQIELEIELNIVEDEDREQ
jgi:hypothetical protein